MVDARRYIYGMVDKVKETVEIDLRQKLEGILTRKVALSRQRAALAEEDRKLDRDLADLRSAGRVWGISLPIPAVEPSVTGHVTVRYRTADGTMREEVRSAPTPLLFAGSTALVGPTAPAIETKTQDTKVSPAPARPAIRDIVLDRLKAAGAKGDGATAIRQFIERVYDDKIHEKTVGMTLYRLAQDGLVRREGRTWFLAQEAGSPGADTPGPETAKS